MVLLILLSLPLLDFFSPAKPNGRDDVGVCKDCTLVLLLLLLLLVPLLLDFFSPANTVDKEDVGVGKDCTFVILSLLFLDVSFSANALDREDV